MRVRARGGNAEEGRRFFHLRRTLEAHFAQRKRGKCVEGSDRNGGERRKRVGAYPEVRDLVLEDPSREGEDAMQDLLEFREGVEEGAEDDEKGCESRESEFNEELGAGKTHRSLTRQFSRSLSSFLLECEDSPVLTPQVQTLPHQPHPHRRRVVQAHLLEAETRDERDTREAVFVPVAKKNERPEGRAEHDGVELEVTIVDEDQGGL